MQNQLAEFGFGRVLLHVPCACQDHEFQWHWRGIRREIYFVEFLKVRAANGSGIGCMKSKLNALRKTWSLLLVTFSVLLSADAGFALVFYMTTRSNRRARTLNP